MKNKNRKKSNLISTIGEALGSAIAWIIALIQNAFLLLPALIRRAASRGSAPARKQTRSARRNTTRAADDRPDEFPAGSARYEGERRTAGYLKRRRKAERAAMRRARRSRGRTAAVRGTRRLPRAKHTARIAAIVTVCAACAAIAVASALITKKNVYSLTVDLNGDPDVTVEYQTEYKDAGATARYSGSLIRIHNKHVKVDVENPVDTGTLGDYEVHFTAEQRGLTADAVRTVHVVDTVSPQIRLTNRPDAFTVPGQAYEEEGFSATDNHDGDITDRVSSEERDGKVYYTVTDSSGNTATAERAIVYDDRTPPEIKLDADSLELVQDDKFEDQFTATDDLDGDLTQAVTVEGKVDASTPGTYTLRYTVTDAHGNTATAERTVEVLPLPQNDPSLAVNGEKIVFLTFDDGPGPYTERLLALLKKYNAKATFFVTAQFSEYLDLLTQEAADGHTVGVHTLTHDFKTVYASEEAYWADFDAMNDIIEEKTGSRTKIFRFPGGSSNTISRNINKGIMSRLTAEATKKGLDYYDWNVYDGDAGETQDPRQIAENILSGIRKNDISVVLCHDIKEYTVDGMEQVLRQALKEGYTFLPITYGCCKSHQTVLN